MHVDLLVALYVLLASLNLADAVVTINALKAGATERNPIIAAAVGHFGVEAGVILPKLAVLGLVWVFLPDFSWVALGAACGFYLYWLARGFKK
jgi:hypothetical protein